ncbi:response regulator [Marinoscillum sp. MHG1-6]|uniref:response regulator n=1 Tax=Marinoscillum sp. MHG1-6 TaxID=2959627 RepID=UPI0021581C74|nr:response regulator [Marinoscillum sp. MHG1-6]
MKDDRLAQILYVDDEVFNLQLFQLTFKNKYEIIVAESGEEGLQILKKNDQIRLIISDMNMPSMNGLEFLSKAKKLDRNIPSVILSGYTKTHQIDDAISSGLIADYFMKPLNRDELDEFISVLFK